jgi:hypothetical protein
MLWRIISFLFIPVFIWVLIGSYRQLKRDYNISGLFSKILWLLIIAYTIVNLFVYAVFNASVVPTLKHL